jgi:hypothetical protein
VTRAWKTLDCANKVRVHYQLPRAIDDEFLKLFPSAWVTVQPFSRLVSGAKDHVTIADSNRFRAAGVMGEPHLVVTYGKTAWEWSPAEITAFEARLARAGFGEVTYGQ